MRYKSYGSCDRDKKKLVRGIYETAFPKEEKFPFWVLRSCAMENNVRLDAVIDPETDTAVGMRFLVGYDDITYLMYLAMDEAFRNKRYGSDALKDLVARTDTALLCVERPSADAGGIKGRRKGFYLRNGFYETGLFIKDSGVEYEFLSSNKDRAITKADLTKRYSCMAKNPFIKFVIRNTFDSDIHFID